ncbi:MAG: hypothetical protein QOJ59_3570 [Thermomicrobiales bacterium]|nr:hypothetical protein [Thermomicrobiales bacterium]
MTRTHREFRSPTLSRRRHRRVSEVPPRAHRCARLPSGRRNRHAPRRHGLRGGARAKTNCRNPRPARQCLNQSDSVSWAWIKGVRTAGFEPARVAPAVFKTAASAIPPRPPVFRGRYNERAFRPVLPERIAWSGRRDSNPRPSPWQGDALPLSHFRIAARRIVGT